MKIQDSFSQTLTVPLNALIDCVQHHLQIYRAGKMLPEDLHLTMMTLDNVLSQLRILQRMGDNDVVVDKNLVDIDENEKIDFSKDLMRKYGLSYVASIMNSYFKRYESIALTFELESMAGRANRVRI